ncbi:MAG: ADP-glyceromanno-heptose 6-epimerase [Crocinitomicaceae bacterium]|nr:ADP-glyceromanno-heptose 6-epimerase [Crocinitomicaceae bacterium]|tara:strand:- start:4473 stop:5429 length:957 start_codon:yes stop_codon:yes gene_type:complete
MIVVTGAAGFIGSQFISTLNQEGFNDIILVDDFTKVEKKGNYSDLVYTGKIERSAFPKWLKDNENQVQFVFHLGARADTAETNIELLNELNLDYSKTVWKLCVEYGLALVYASSAATYGDGAYGYLDSHDIVFNLQPLNPYGDSKNEFDKWVLQQERKPYFWAGLKFFNVFGPGESHKNRMASVVLHTFRQVSETGRMKLFRSHNPKYKDGEQSRDFVYVKDVCRVCFYMMINRLTTQSGLYNLGSGKARTFFDLVSATIKSMGVAPRIEFIDTPEDIRDNYQYFTEADLSKLRASGYTEEFTSLEDGIKDYVENYLL